MGAESSTETAAETNATTTDVNGTGASEGGSGPETANQEAARHRVRAREAEAERDAAISERDTLAGVVESLRTSIVNERVEAAGMKPDLLWASRVTIADLLSDAKDGEDGAGLIDTAKVDKALDTARNMFGLPPTAGYNPSVGRDQGEPPRDPDQAFTDAFTPPGTHP